MILYRKKSLITGTPYVVDIKKEKGIGAPPDYFHPCKYSGGFILLGGWIKIFDETVQKGTRGHELYLAFGGAGVGWFDGEGELHPWTESWDEFYNTVKSFCYLDAYDPEDPETTDTGPHLVFYDKHSHQIGSFTFAPSAHCPGLAGGTVKVKS